MDTQSKTIKSNRSIRPPPSASTSSADVPLRGAEQLQSNHLWLALPFLLLVGLLLLGLNMRRGLNHDEHQFIASSALLARDGLLPYGDYPYFHMPLLVFIYALFFTWGESLLLAARLFSVSCSWLMLILLFIHTRRRSQHLTPTRQFLWPIVVILSLMNSELFLYTSGRAWNHDLPVLLTVGAILIFGRVSSDQKYGNLLFIAGIFMGLATITRLSFAFTTLAFFVVIVWEQERLKQWSTFSLGAIIGSSPALYLFWRAPSQFIFGNVEYVRLNTQYFAVLDEPPVTMALLGKLWNMLLIFVEPGNLLLLTLFLFALWFNRATLWGNGQKNSLLRLILVAWIFTLLGALTPTPSQSQYFYALIPLMALVAVQLGQHIPNNIYMMQFLLIVLLFGTLSRYAEGAMVLPTPEEWYPNRLHAHAQKISSLASEGPVLTLAPIFPLEAKQAIYPELATGPFAWRISKFLSPQQRVEQHIIAPDDLENLLAEQPPRSLLTNVDNDESETDQPLIDYAQMQGFMPLMMPDEGKLWLSPLHRWEDAIQLGGHTLPRTPVMPGNQYPLVFYLQNSGPIDRDLNMVVRIVDSTDHEIWRSEGWPWGAATSQWQAGDVWPDGRLLIVPTGTPKGIYRVELGFYDPQTLDDFGAMAVIDYLWIGGLPQSMPDSKPLARLGQTIQLQDVAVNEEALDEDGVLSVDIVWQAVSQPDGAYTTFVHLVGPDGQLVAQQDRPPLSGFFPTDAWQLGWSIEDSYTLSELRDLPAGMYEIYIGLYDSLTIEALPIFVEEGAVGTRLPIATVQID